MEALWIDADTKQPPSGGKLLLYTKYGILIVGQWGPWCKGYITHWMKLPPSPGKQQGALK